MRRTRLTLPSSPKIYSLFHFAHTACNHFQLYLRWSWLAKYVHETNLLLHLQNTISFASLSNLVNKHLKEYHRYVCLSITRTFHAKSPRFVHNSHYHLTTFLFNQRRSKIWKLITMITTGKWEKAIASRFQLRHCPLLKEPILSLDH